MSNFINSKQKMNKIWQKIAKNTIELSDLDNASQLPVLYSFPKTQTIKNIDEIYNSSFLPTTVSSPSDTSFQTTDINGNILTKSVTIDTLLPQRYFYQHQLNLQIPEVFLPFIKVVPEIKCPPSHKLTLGGKYISSQYGSSNDIIQIKGNDTMLFQGHPSTIQSNLSRTNVLLSAFDDEESLAIYKIPIGNTKKIYNMKIFYTQSGKDYSIEGAVTEMTLNYDLGASCHTNNNGDYYDGLFFQEGGNGERHDNEILALTNSSFTIKAKKTETRYVNIPPCTLQTTILDGVTKTDSFSNVSEYTISIYGQKRNITDNVFVGNNQTVTIPSSWITGQTASFKGYRAYYDNLNQGVLSTFNTGDPDGNYFRKYELFVDNLPNENDGHTLTYSSIVFRRNYDTFDSDVFETDEYIQHSAKPLPVFFKKGDDTFYVNFIGSFLLVSPATVIDINSRQFPKYDDEYTVSGTTYTKSTELHEFLETPIYTPEITDPEVRIKLHLKNPLYWKEDRNYGV